MTTATTTARRAKVGSDRRAAARVGGKGDFGVRPDDRIERDYVSEETRHNDPGAAHTRIKTGDSARESGVGAYDSGRGSGSGGDIDTDIVGVGTGGSGVSQSGPDERTDGADMTTRGSSDDFAAPGKRGHPRHKPRRSQGRGTTVDRSGGDLSTTGGGLDSGSASNPQARNDDSFAADIQIDEASGSDNAGSDRR